MRAMLRGNLRRALGLAFRRTHRGPPVPVTLYEKADCHLCAEAYRALVRLSLDVPLDILRVDIEADPALLDRYALRIPVVMVDGRELDAAEVGERALRDFVSHRSG